MPVQFLMADSAALFKLFVATSDYARVFFVNAWQADSSPTLRRICRGDLWKNGTLQDEKVTSNVTPHVTEKC